MFSKPRKKAIKRSFLSSNEERLSTRDDSEDIHNENEADNNNINIQSDNDDDQSTTNYDQSFIEEEEPSLSDNSTSIYPNNYKFSELHGLSKASSLHQFTDFIDPSEISILKAEIQNRFDVRLNVALPVVVEYSLGAISDRADIDCKSIHNNVEELSALTEEIVQKTKECNHLISKLNEYTIKVSNDLRTTQKSMQQIKIPRRSLLQLLMLLLLWIFNIFIIIYHKIKSRNRTSIGS